MPDTPTPRFTDLDTAQAYLNVKATSDVKQIVLTGILCAAENVVERYCRRRFAAEPVFQPATGYQRVSVGITGTQAIPNLQGYFSLSLDGATWFQVNVPCTAAQLQTATDTLLGVGNSVCSGGPLATYPISITYAGTLTGIRPELRVDSTGLRGGVAVIDDCGFDSNPPVLKRFTTRGKTMCRLPDLRVVDASPDPRVNDVSGVTLYSRRLLPNQYYLGYNAYAAGGADETIGSSDAEPATDITLGYGYGTGYSMASQFAYVLPLGYMANDLQIVGRWGFSSVPADIVDAVYRVTARGYRERDAAFSDQMITPDGVMFQFFKQLPAYTQAVLMSYKVPNLALV